MSGKISRSHRLNVSTVAALTAGTVRLWVFYNILFLIFGSTSTGSQLQHVHVLFSHNEPITTFWSTQNVPSCHKTRLLSSKYHTIALRQGQSPGPQWKTLPRGRFAVGGGRTRREERGKGTAASGISELESW